MLKFKYFVVWVGVLSFFNQGGAFAVGNPPPAIEAQKKTVAKRGPNPVEKAQIRRVPERKAPQIKRQIRLRPMPASNAPKAKCVVAPNIRQNIRPRLQANAPRRAIVRIAPVARPIRIVPRRVHVNANRQIVPLRMVRRPLPPRVQPKRALARRVLPNARQVRVIRPPQRARLVPLQRNEVRGHVNRVPQQQVNGVPFPRLTARATPQRAISTVLQGQRPPAQNSRTYRLRFGDLPQEFKDDFIRELRAKRLPIPEDDTEFPQEDGETLSRILNWCRDHYSPAVTERVLTYFRSLGFQG